MRCPDCQKFVSYGEREPEVNSEDLDGDTLTVDVSVILECSECGTDLKGSDMSIEIDLLSEHDCLNGEPYFGEDEDGAEEGEDPEELTGEDRWDVDEVTASYHERYETVDRKGKTITNPRYMTKYYGAELSVSVTCKACKEEFTVEEVVEEAASSFDELV